MKLNDLALDYLNPVFQGLTVDSYEAEGRQYLHIYSDRLHTKYLMTIQYLEDGKRNWIYNQMGSASSQFSYVLKERKDANLEYEVEYGFKSGAPNSECLKIIHAILGEGALETK